MSSFRAGVVRPVRLVARFVLRHPANRGRRIRALATSALWQAWKRVTDLPVIVPLGESSRLIVYPDSRFARRVLFANPPDYYQMTFLRRMMQPGDVFVDVGANVGSYSLLAAEAGASVIAIEPSTDNFKRLCENVRLNGYGDLISCRRAAAGVERGETFLTVGLDSWNYVIEPSWREASVPTERIKVVPVDDVVGERIVTGMKIDVQGQERAVLDGCSRALREGRIGYIQVENVDQGLYRERLRTEPDRVSWTWRSMRGRPPPNRDSKLWNILRDSRFRLYRFGGDGALVPEGEFPEGFDVIALGPDLSARAKEKGWLH
jgi:FkbM family methyltransferase